MKNIVKWISVGLLPMLLTGCGFTMHDFNTSDKFTSQDKAALGMFTVSCNLHEGDVNLEVKSLQSAYETFSTALPCNGPQDLLTLPYVEVIRFDKPGTYYFSGFNGDYPDGIYREVLRSKHFKKVYFDIKPGVVNYLGWIKLQSRDSGHIGLSAYNAKKRDTALFKNLAPNVSAPIVTSEPYTIK